MRHKKEMHKQWEQGRMAWEEYSDAVQMCRDGIWKVKVLMEVTLARDAGVPKDCFLKGRCPGAGVRHQVFSPWFPMIFKFSFKNNLSFIYTSKYHLIYTSIIFSV